jgi:hypothetical protein
MLTYCTNIHPGESWEEITETVWPQVLAVKRRVSPHRPFPVGLRLSALAAASAVRGQGETFRERLGADGCYVPTLNGFPYGSFHSGRVKERAYLPDWRSRQRLEYTLDLVRLLQLWLPPSVTGSISTVPVGSGRRIDAGDLPLVRRNLVTVLQELERAAEAGRNLVLALEPEPGCVLETVADVVEFLDRMELPPSLRPFLGVCFDCCHAAVAREEPEAAFSLLRQAGIPVPKIQLSSAPCITRNHREAARLFREPRYLHQVSVLRDGEILRFRDLCDALSLREPAGEWRIHYHLPLFDDGNGLYGTTNGFIRKVLACRPPEALLEIETYTHHVLPRELSPLPLHDSICREFSWVGSCP